MIPYPKARVWCTWVSFSSVRQVVFNRLARKPFLERAHVRIGMLFATTERLVRNESAIRVNADVLMRRFSGSLERGASSPITM